MGNIKSRLLTGPEVSNYEAVNSERNEQWASTMGGVAQGSICLAHGDDDLSIAPIVPILRGQREDIEESQLARGATLSRSSKGRAIPEPEDEFRTCFERDRDRILHSSSFRRLAGKTQVFIFPADHQRTRLTHALEVAQVAVSIARACGLNQVLAEAIALGHDCGHGPGGHASEDALSIYVEGGYDHAVWGADVALSHLNLSYETLDGIRNHSWSRPSPSTPEGIVVSWADRIAYCCHDFEDAVLAGIISQDQLPEEVSSICGTKRSSQLRTFILDIVNNTCESGIISMSSRVAGALSGLRQFNYQHIYHRQASKAQEERVIRMLRALVDHYLSNPNLLPDKALDSSRDLATNVVSYVAGMTDRYCSEQSLELLDWSENDLPIGISGRSI